MRIAAVPLVVLALLGSISNAECPYNHGHSGLRKRDAPDNKKGTMLFNRLAPGSSVLFIANSDGSNLRRLLDNSSAVFEYHASFSPDGQYITYTSERRGNGQADLYRVRVDGSDIEELIATDSVEDQSRLSPDGTKLAYVSSANGWKANIWVKDLTTVWQHPHSLPICYHAHSGYEFLGRDSKLNEYTSGQRSVMESRWLFRTSLVTRWSMDSIQFRPQHTMAWPRRWNRLGAHTGIITLHDPPRWH